MNHPLRILYHMVKADFLERVRRYSFLLILAGALVAGLWRDRGESHGRGWRRVSRRLQLGMDRHDDGDLLLDVCVALRILCGQEFRGARLGYACRTHSGSNTDAQGDVYSRENGE